MALLGSKRRPRGVAAAPLLSPAVGLEGGWDPWDYRELREVTQVTGPCPDPRPPTSPWRLPFRLFIAALFPNLRLLC